MTPPNNLDLQGNSRIYPLAEVLCEIGQAKLDGSLRLSNGEQKVIVYFRGGEIIFAVSNARSSRLFEILLRQNRVLKQTLSEFSEFANDHALAEFLVKRKVLLRAEINSVFDSQISGTLQSIIAWNSGEWTFSPLVRLRENINFKVDQRKFLIEYARHLPPEIIHRKLANVEEIFHAAPLTESGVQMLPKEAFVLSRFAGSPLKISEIIQLSGLPEAETLQTIYVLWLGGFLIRKNWNAAFSPEKIESILAAKISLVKEASSHAPVVPLAAPVREQAVENEPEEIVREITVEEYLERVENAKNSYEILGIDAKTAQAEIKPGYFLLAKRFHPDIFHKETDAKLLQRIQTAFTDLAKAYENLKTKESRDTYDFKIRKELAELEKKREMRESADSKGEAVNSQAEDQADDNFLKGFNLLMEENYGEAVPFLARAVHFSPQTARYHAYYGKALSVAEKYRHKAETELQTAVKIEAQNPTFRIMLAEFFIQYNLLKRAEGELNRLLTISPDNKEAKQLLDSLAKK